MLRLIQPCKAYLPSYTEAFDEYRTFQRRSGNPYRNPHVQDVLAYFDDMRSARNLPAGYVGSSTYWLVDDEQQRFLGQIDIRHALTDRLLRYGGHIGYAVRLGEWNKGYGTLMLSLALPCAKALGIERCLITCDDDNPGSARVMEKNDFVLGDKIDNVIDGQAIITRRYWKNLLRKKAFSMNIILIGMPGCGKSTVGVVLAKAANMDFIDSDLVIQKEMGMKLSAIIDQYGDDGFRDIENRINAGLKLESSVIATGGSVIYGEEAMRHLKNIGTVVYLKLSYEGIKERLGDLHARGVTIKPGWTLHDLYNERCPMYELWADLTVDCEKLCLREVVETILEKLEA